MNISIPDELKQLRALVVHGMESGTGSEMNDDYFDQLRERILNSDEDGPR